MGFIAVIIVMIIVDASALVNNIQIINQVNNLERSKRIELTESNKVAYNIQRIKSNIRELFLEMESGERPDEVVLARREIEINLTELLEALDALYNATHTGYLLSEAEEDKEAELGELAIIDSINLIIPEFITQAQATLKLMDENNYKEAEDKFENELEPVSRDIQNIMSVIVDDSEEEITWAISQLNKKVDKTIRLGIYLTVLSILLSLAIGLYISRSISRPLYKLIYGTKEIEKGNLATTVELGTKGELGLLADSFNKMARELRSRIESINQLNKELEQSNQTKDKFFSIIAHDLKNPFNIILGFTDLLVEQYQDFDENERKEIVSELNNTSKIVYDLLENLLTWSRTQSGKIELYPANLKLDSIVTESIASYSGNARQKQISIVNNIPEDIEVYADRFTVSVVLNNVLNNAIKFTRDGGQITLAAKKVQELVEISIKDTGVGMSRKIIDFLLLDESITSTPGTRNEKGTGLGLTLIKEFISKNNGFLNIESKPEQGTDFRFSLPAKSPVNQIES